MRTRFAIPAFLAFAILLTAGTQAHSSPPSHEPRADLAKICSAKNPPPCATIPHATYSPEPEFSDQARKAGYEGVCTLKLIVEPDGHTSHIRMTSSLGMGLDEKAIEAVKRWKFEPALQDGKPVPVEITVEVSFRIYHKH